MVWKLRFLAGPRESEWFHVFATRKEALKEAKQLEENFGYKRMPTKLENWKTVDVMTYAITKEQSVYHGA